MDFHNKVMLAPMVRMGTLPLRALAMDYGADIVYSEELVDLNVLECSRTENHVLGTVDFSPNSQDKPLFRTDPKREKDRLVFQVGTSDAERALSVAKAVEHDVAAFDVNMGCPKAFSIQGGMGAALLSKPEKVKKILETLVTNVNVPVTCKIRLLNELEDSLELCKMIERTGVAALAIHGRTRTERPSQRNRNHQIRTIAQSLSIPVIANGGSGEIKCYEDIERFKEATGCSSVMMARAAAHNPSIFRPEGLLPIHDVIKSYLHYCVLYDSIAPNAKYVMQRFLGEEQTTTERGRELLAAFTMRQICKTWDMTDTYISIRAKQRDLSHKQQIGITAVSSDDLSDCHSSAEDIRFLHISIPKRHFESKSPKCALYEWARLHRIRKPEYKTLQNTTDKKFRSIVTVDSKRFSSSFWERNKQMCEQGAALTALYYLGLKSCISAEYWEDVILPS